MANTVRIRRTLAELLRALLLDDDVRCVAAARRVLIAEEEEVKSSNQHQQQQLPYPVQTSGSTGCSPTGKHPQDSSDNS
ncbi:hypothetical protein TYRP_022196 [Tyrophagus putrescentiae]|nr:hypothetical protein TYRP_022196 [Tyrophagus putrescentiae]